MKDQAKLLKLLKDFNMPYTTFKQKEYLNEDAVKSGASICISVRSYLDIYFDKNGKAIGTATERIHSFIKAKRRRK